MMINKTPLSKSELFQRYLEICNEALEANKNRFPFKQILDAARGAGKSRAVEVCIIDDRPEGTYVLKIDQDRIVAQGHEQCQNCLCDATWRVTKTYLEDVVRNPQAYINNPAKIDWEWMVGKSE